MRPILPFSLVPTVRPGAHGAEGGHGVAAPQDAAQRGSLEAFSHAMRPPAGCHLYSTQNPLPDRQTRLGGRPVLAILCVGSEGCSLGGTSHGPCTGQRRSLAARDEA